MCLYTKTSIPKIAEHDIVCYKILLKSEWIKRFLWFKKRKHNYFTPITLTRVKPEGIMHAVGDSTISEANLVDMSDWNQDWDIASEDPNRNDIKIYEVSRGYIHTFKNLPDAKQFINYSALSAYGYKEIGIFKCIIPCGTKYYEGGTCILPSGAIIGRNSYASTKIKFIKRIKTFDL